MTASRTRQLEWLKEAMEKTGLSPNALAEQAKVNPSTLYRFLDADSETVLRPVTINRLAKAAKMQPPFSGMEDGEVREYELADLPSTRPPGPKDSHLGGLEILNDAMAGAGIVPGDLLIYDRNRAPKAGDLVVAQVYDFRLGAAETVVRWNHPPYLVAASTDPVLRKPRVVDNDSVTIVGVVVRQIRVKEWSDVA